ncbi:major facilitator superfamily domain-containing protein [Salix suchowensis]|nr:major facilitator superfamily domain-containing protein [Salix suchowensis]
MAWGWIYLGCHFIFFSVWWLLAMQNLGFPLTNNRNYFIQHVCCNLQCGLGCHPSFTHVHGELHLTEFNEQGGDDKLSECFTMVANLSLYAVALVVFSTTKATTHSDIENQYHWIAYTSIFIGCCFVGIFHLRTKEPRWLCFLQAYLAFYVIEDLRMAKSAKALVPAIIYISSFIVSIIMQEMSWTGQRLKAYYCAGGIIWVFCGTSILFLPRSLSAFMYVISVFIGVANTLMTVTGVSMQSVLVGSDLNGCAFVYGSLSFLDKVSCGLAVFVLQSFQSSSPRSQESLSTEYISVTRYGLGLLPAVCSLAGMGITYTMKLRTTHSKSLMEPLLD